MSQQVINVIVSLQKSYDSEQDGLCGNFDCNEEDDAIEQTTRRGLHNVSSSDNLFTELTARLPSGVRQPGGALFDMTQSRERCAKVGSSLRMACGMDVAYAKPHDRGSTVQKYELLSTLWDSV